MKLLRQKAVTDLTGLPRSTLYAAIKDGKFPKAVRIGKRSVAWRSVDIEQWINERSGGLC